MKVRITNDGQHGYATRITNVETGEEIPHVMRVQLDLSTTGDVPKALLVIALPVLDVIADADTLHVCPCCGAARSSVPLTITEVG